MKRTICILLVLLCVSCVAFAEDVYSKKYKGSDIYELAAKKYKTADKIEEYLCFYDSVWGTLHESVGEVAFSTLTEEQRQLVNFPELDHSHVYHTPSGKSYHSTDKCYTLLRSKEIRSSIYVEAILNGHKSGCSKCVK